LRDHRSSEQSIFRAENTIIARCFSAGFKRICLISTLFILVACTPTSPYRLYDTAPTLFPAFRVDSNGVLAIWHDGAKLNAAQGKLRVQLPLGIKPHGWQIYSGDADESQLLWLDQKGRETHLYTARLSGVLQLLRGPTDVSTTDTLEFAGLTLFSNDLLTLWTERNPLQPATPLYLQVIDQTGRPRTSTKIASDARFPTLTVDSRKVIHATWLEPQIGGVYAIRYAQISNESIESELISQPVVVGIIAPEKDQAVERIALCTDDSYIYQIWGEINSTTERGRIFAFAFNVDPVHQFVLSEEGRWPVALSRGNQCKVAFTQTYPVSLTLSEGKISRTEIFSETAGTLGGVSLAGYNGVWLGWTTLEATGGAFYARPVN